MMTSTVVNYTVNPDAMAEHVQLVEAVFHELDSSGRADVDYAVYRLADGVSVLHVSTADTPDGTNPLPTLASFRAFSAGLADRVTSGPTPQAVELIARYRPSAVD